MRTTRSRTLASLVLVCLAAPSAGAQDTAAVWRRDGEPTVERAEPRLVGAEPGSRWAQGRDPLEAGAAVRRRDRVWRVDPDTGERGECVLDVTGEALLEGLPDELLEGVATPVALRATMRAAVDEMPHVVELTARVSGEGVAVERTDGEGAAAVRVDVVEGERSVPLTLTVEGTGDVARVVLVSPGWGRVVHAYRRTSEERERPAVPADDPAPAPERSEDPGAGPGDDGGGDDERPRPEPRDSAASRSEGTPATGRPVPTDAPLAASDTARAAGARAAGRDRDALGLVLAEEGDGAGRRIVVERVVVGFGFPGEERVRPGDVLVAVDGYPVEGLDVLDGVLRVVGAPRALTVRRGGAELDVPVPRPVAIPGLAADATPAEVAALARVWATAGGPGALGVELADGLNGGAVVTGVDGADGLAVGDLVTSVDGAPVADAADLAGRLELVPAGTRVRLGVERIGGVTEVEVALAPVHAPEEVAAVRVAILTGRAGGVGLAGAENVFRLRSGLAFRAPLELLPVDPDDSDTTLELRPLGGARDSVVVAVMETDVAGTPFEFEDSAQLAAFFAESIEHADEAELLAGPEIVESGGLTTIRFRAAGEVVPGAGDVVGDVVVVLRGDVIVGLVAGCRPGLVPEWGERLAAIVDSLAPAEPAREPEEAWITWSDAETGLSFRAPQDLVRNEGGGMRDEEPGLRLRLASMGDARDAEVELALLLLPREPDTGSVEDEAREINRDAPSLPWLRGRAPASVVELGGRPGLLIVDGEPETDEPWTVGASAGLDVGVSHHGVVHAMANGERALRLVPELESIVRTLRYTEPRR